MTSMEDNQKDQKQSSSDLIYTSDLPSEATNSPSLQKKKNLRFVKFQPFFDVLNR